jgi:hypothetical protein
MPWHAANRTLGFDRRLQFEYRLFCFLENFAAGVI